MVTKLARVVLLICVAVLVGLAGCGGDDDSGGGNPLGVTQEGDGSTETSGGAGEAVAGLGSDDCRKLAELGATLGQATSGASGSEDVEDQVRLFEEFANQTPEDVRDDFQVLAEEYKKIAEALADANLQSGEQPDPEALQKLQEAFQSVDQKRLEEANTNIQKWTEENCRE